MSELMNIIKSRRSTRAFKPELPPVEQIRRIVEAAEWAPSGMGRYNWHFSVVYNPEKTLKLARAIAEADNRGPLSRFNDQTDLLDRRKLGLEGTGGTAGFEDRKSVV